MFSVTCSLRKAQFAGAILAMWVLSAPMSPSDAQNYAQITGTVTDTSGAVVVDAYLRVTNTATGQVREIRTNETGNYTVPFLVPGVYAVRAEREGFKPLTRSDVLLQVGDVARVDFKMELGAVTEAIEVHGGATLLNTENAVVGTVIENRRIEDCR